MRDWAATLDWPDKLPLAEMTPAHRAMTRSCPLSALAEIKEQAHARQVAMAGRVSSAQGSTIPVEEIAAMFRLRSFLIAREVVLTVDQMWAAITPEGWSWVRRPREAGGFGVTTPEEAQVAFGDRAMFAATELAASWLGETTATHAKFLAAVPIDILLDAYARLRSALTTQDGVLEFLQAMLADDRARAIAGTSRNSL